jgi:hypothetical protein
MGLFGVYCKDWVGCLQSDLEVALLRSNRIGRAFSAISLNFKIISPESPTARNSSMKINPVLCHYSL